MFKSFVTGGVGSLLSIIGACLLGGIMALSQTDGASGGVDVMLLIGLAIFVVGKFMSYQSSRTVCVSS